MFPRNRAACIFALSLAIVAAKRANGQAILTDPKRDATNPARLEAVWIPSAGMRINGVFLLAAGAQPHPTAVIFHGLPGNEQNLDLAQALRSAGFNVLTFHYRGSWGSPGRYSLAAGIDDGHAAIAFLRDPTNASRFRIDTKRLIVVGHSYGGFVATRVAAAHPDLAAAVLIAPWNMGADIPLLQVPDAGLPQIARQMFDDIEGRLGGATELDLARELLSPAHDWRMETSAPSLGRLPLLVIVAAHDAPDCQAAPLLSALKKSHAPAVTVLTMDTDHSFSDHRIALETSILDWLRARGL